jgi:dTDP-4-dehydrorhamnose reductase
VSESASPLILLTGSSGQIGGELQPLLSRFATVIAPDLNVLDFSKPDSLRRVIRDTRPNLVVNAAAYTAVDRAESEPELAREINAEAPAVMAEECKKIGAALITYSTDYVFDGTASEPYTEECATNPLSVYGRTKLQGDQAIQSAGGSYLIFRTSWIYGVTGKNFLLTMLRMAHDRTSIRIVDDQIGAPTWSRTVAEVTARIISKGLEQAGAEGLARYIAASRGVYNLTASGQTSWFGFAEAIFRHRGLNKNLQLVPIPTAEYPTPATRPRWSVLSNEKLRRTFGISNPHWEDDLKKVLECLVRQESAAICNAPVS